MRAASLRRFSRSAPVKPTVERATSWRSTSFARGFFLAWILRIASRSSASGILTMIRLSKRPGRRSAGSRTSTRLVAAITITLELTSKPSISTKIWFNVCSRSSCPPPRPAPLLRPTASISSMNTTEGASFLASAKSDLTREAPTPTSISTKSEPEI